FNSTISYRYIDLPTPMIYTLSLHDALPIFYCARKHGDEEPEYLHPMLEPILKETFGVIIYQEQVMQIAQVMAGYSLGEADLLRRSEEHTSELQSRFDLVCRLLLEKKNTY